LIIFPNSLATTKFYLLIINYFSQ